MKTPRRRFLSVLGGALLSRAVRAEDDLFSGTPAPDDPLELLYSRRLSFSGGEPLITVRVLEGRQQIVFVPKGPLTARVRSRSGEMTTAVAGGASGRWTLQLLESSQGAGASWVELEQLRYDDKQGLQKAREDWAAKRVAIRIANVGVPGASMITGLLFPPIASSVSALSMMRASLYVPGSTSTLPPGSTRSIPS